jgi:hypothetical protein
MQMYIPKQTFSFSKLVGFGLLGLSSIFVLFSPNVWADGVDATAGGASVSATPNGVQAAANGTTVQTGTTPTPQVPGVLAGVFDHTGNGINGNVSSSNVSSNANNVTTGANSNENQNQTYVSSPAQAVGGSSALVLPRNPLPLGNAGLGRSNFGLQFGLNNNPVLSNIFSKGTGNALSWFLQGGLTIPFGKIPDVIANPRNSQADDVRLQRLDDDRQVFGTVNPLAKATVQGHVVSLNAYNYSTAASPKIDNLQDALKAVEGKVEASTPKVVALADCPVFSKPLNKGQQIGTTATGDEYRYIGHTSSGWVKLGLPDGRMGWSKGQFEYLKNDYTEVDALTAHNSLDNVREALDNKQNRKLISINTHK